MPSQSTQPILVFDIETIPDEQASQRVYGFEKLSGEALTQALAQKRKDDLGHDFPRLPLHEVVCLSGLWFQPSTNPNQAQKLRVFSLSQKTLHEADILSKFFQTLQQHQPRLVSYNGKAFDIPVLGYRAMLHQLSCATLYDQGQHSPAAKYHNYQNRYHSKHIDVMDVLARFNPKYFQPLDLVARFLDLPGKVDETGAVMDGHAVAQLVHAQQWQRLESYCEHDVLNTWLIYLRLMHLYGNINEHTLKARTALTRTYLTEAGKYDEFLSLW